MNKIWVSISLISLLYGLFTGRYIEISDCILSLPLDALNLTVTLVFTACFFNGIMMIMYQSGLIDFISLGINPLLNIIMPNLKDDIAKKYISMNIAANMFGLGFAATPAGLNAMKRLQEISQEKDKTVASDEMVTFLILNTAGVTLIPTTVIAIRQQYGSSNPTDFMVYGIIGTLCSCVGGLLLDKLFKKIH